MQRIPELDGLRGIAAIAVVAHHYVNAWISSPKGDSLESTAKLLTRWGFAGVNFFCAIRLPDWPNLHPELYTCKIPQKVLPETSLS